MCCARLKLVEPVLGLKNEFQAMAREYLTVGEQEQDWRFEQALDDFKGYVKKLHNYSVGKKLPESWIPKSTYWLVKDKRRLLGHSSVRHTLTPALHRFGGHIGYYIRPSQRGKGYGTKILGLTIEKAKQLDLKKVLITCDDDNQASIRIIESFGGMLQDKVMNEGHEVLTRRYWIEIG
jgi:predicted acetyltransferase